MRFARACWCGEGRERCSTTNLPSFSLSGKSIVPFLESSGRPFTVKLHQVGWDVSTFYFVMEGLLRYLPSLARLRTEQSGRSLQGYRRKWGTAESKEAEEPYVQGERRIRAMFEHVILLRKTSIASLPS